MTDDFFIFSSELLFNFTANILTINLLPGSVKEASGSAGDILEPQSQTN